MIFDDTLLIVLLSIGIFVLFALIGYLVEVYKKNKDLSKNDSSDENNLYVNDFVDNNELKDILLDDEEIK